MLDISLLGVLVSTVVMMLLGALWYSPMLFGSHWIRLLGLKKKDLAEMKEKSARGYILGFLAAFIISFVMDLMLSFFGVQTVAEGAVLGLMVWLGFVLTTNINPVLWEGKPVSLFLLNTGYYLVGFVIIGMVLTLF